MLEKEISVEALGIKISVHRYGEILARREINQGATSAYKSEKLWPGEAVTRGQTPDQRAK